ncbi:MAG: metallophosphoesterase [Clostridia bacterium]|nr:metallophosphoesterase [Clostridia bacterium]
MDFTTVVMYLKDLLATVMTLLMMMSPAFSGNGVAYEAQNPDELITSFVVVSDIHVETNNPESYENFSDVLYGIKAGKDIDAVIYTGDNVMNGQFLENVFFYSAIRSMMPAENNLVVVGNHDLGNGAGDHDKSRNDFIANNNLYFGADLDEPYYYRVINGCYFICISTEVGDPSQFYVSDKQYSWLEGVLKEAKAAGAPTFVFAHFPIRDISQGGDKFAALLKDYNVSLYCHGHYHNDLVAGNFYNWGGINSINLPRVTETTHYDAGDGIVVEVYEDEILVRGRDFVKGEWIEELVYTYPIVK